MTDLLLNIAPQAPALTSVNRRAEVGALFVAGPTGMLVDAPMAATLRFGDMLRELQLPSVADVGGADPIVKLAPRESDEAADGSVEAAVSLQFAATAELVPVTTTQMQAGVPVPAIVAALDGSEAVAVQNTVQSSTSVATHGMPQISVQQALPPQPTLAVTPTYSLPSPKAEPGNALGENALLQLASQSITSAAATLGAFATEPTPNVVERSVTPARQPLAALLGDRLQTQIAQRSEHAVVRLDPPSMGTIEIVIRHEAGQLHVHLCASNSEVARQLQVIGETLRQDLVQRQHEHVSVHVFDSSREGERQRHRPALPWQEEPGRALQEAGDEAGSFALNLPTE